MVTKGERRGRSPSSCQFTGLDQRVEELQDDKGCCWLWQRKHKTSRGVERTAKTNSTERGRNSEQHAGFHVDSSEEEKERHEDGDDSDALSRVARPGGSTDPAPSLLMVLTAEGRGSALVPPHSLRHGGSERSIGLKFEAV